MDWLMSVYITILGLLGIWKIVEIVSWVCKRIDSRIMNDKKLFPSIIDILNYLETENKIKALDDAVLVVEKHEKLKAWLNKEIIKIEKENSGGTIIGWRLDRLEVLKEVLCVLKKKECEELGLR